MRRLALAVTLRMVRWNALFLASVTLVVALVLGVALAFGDDSFWIALGLPLLWSVVALVLGAVAGVVHGVALLPVVLRQPPRPLPFVRVVATLTSVALVLVVRGGSGVTTVVALPYVVLTPFLAARGYAAAEAAWRRAGRAT